jgi:TolB protein
VNRLAERITGEPGLLGSTIAFVLRQPAYAKVIVATTTHGEQVRLISKNQDISLLPHWSRTGDTLVYTVLARNGTGVYLHSMLKEPPPATASRFLTPQTGLNSGGTFAPDEKRVALTMSMNGSADLYEVNLATNQRTQLTHRDGIETSANWAPKRNELVFVSDRSGTPQVYLLNLERLDDLRLTFDSGYNADPKWSPDGESILFTKRVNGRDQIHVMDRFGENVRAVTSGAYDSEQAEWSPDGKQIVFTSNRSGSFKLYVVSADGTALRRLTHTPEAWEESSPSWTARKLSR